MKTEKLSLVYFSATDTTKKTLRHITGEMGFGVVEEYNITQGQYEEIHFTGSDVVIFGVPVYSGRVPAIAIDALNRFKGQSTPAIVVCVYGNRAYDDALLELKHITEANHFIIVAAGAFVAEHSIFPVVANGRPDSNDKIAAVAFGRQCAERLAAFEPLPTAPSITVKGNIPYREVGHIPLNPKGDSKCNQCGTCVKACPANAIEAAHPRRTDKKRCISCARCIKVCPQDARHFGGILYKIVRRQFQKKYSVRKEPEVFFM